MRKILFVLVGIITCLPMFAENIYEIPKITVRGFAELEVKSDHAEIAFDVVGRGNKIKYALNDCRKKTNRILSELRKIGLKEENFSTDDLANNNHHGLINFIKGKSGFDVTLRTNISISDLSKVEEIVSTIYDLEPNKIYQIQYSIKDIKTAKQKALKLALKNAKEKAQLMAMNLDIELGKVLSIEEIEYYNPNMVNECMPMEAQGLSNDKAMLFAPNEKIASNVMVFFAIK
jgi:uncharacterized protein YggE